MDKHTAASPCVYHGSSKFSAKSYTGKGNWHAQPQRNGHMATSVVGDEAPKAMEPIWDVVSSLAQALNDARDQLATLLQSRSNSPVKSFSRTHQQQQQQQHVKHDTQGGLAAHRSRVPRCYSAPHSRARTHRHNGGHDDEHPGHVHNVHRSHARSFYAFGRNTEVKERMHYSARSAMDCNTNSSAHGDHHGGHVRGMPARGGGGGGHYGNADNYGIRLKGGNGACGIKVIPNGNRYTCIRDKGERGIHLTAKMNNCNMNVDTDGEKFGPHSPVKIRFTTPTRVRFPSPFLHPCPEVKRYCVGTQYANLLREEAHHLREKRMSQEQKIMLNTGRNNTWKHPHFR